MRRPVIDDAIVVDPHPDAIVGNRSQFVATGRQVDGAVRDDGDTVGRYAVSDASPGNEIYPVEPILFHGCPRQHTQEGVSMCDGRRTLVERVVAHAPVDGHEPTRVPERVWG